VSAGNAEPWRPCSACKQPIALGTPYYVCSVSTCNRKRTGLVFPRGSIAEAIESAVPDGA